MSICLYLKLLSMEKEFREIDTLKIPMVLDKLFWFEYLYSRTLILIIR